jgi:hypothetical protein
LFTPSPACHCARIASSTGCKCIRAEELRAACAALVYMHPP